MSKSELIKSMAQMIAFATGRAGWEYPGFRELEQASAVLSNMPDLMREHPEEFGLRVDLCVFNEYQTETETNESQHRGCHRRLMSAWEVNP